MAKIIIRYKFSIVAFCKLLQRHNTCRPLQIADPTEGFKLYAKKMTTLRSLTVLKHIDEIFTFGF